MNENKLHLTFGILDVIMAFFDIKLAFDSTNTIGTVVFIFLAILLAYLAAENLNEYFRGGK